MTYKVNDTVRIVADDNCGFSKGHIGKVTKVDEDDPMYQVDDEYYYDAHELELVTQWEFPRLQVKLKPLTESAVIPQYGSAGAACFDLCADEDVIVAPGQTVAVSTGLSFELPIGYQMKVLPRSGISLRTPLRVVIGTVDTDYVGEVKVLLWNTSGKSYDFCATHKVNLDTKVKTMNDLVYHIRKGDRIAQAEVIPVTQVDFDIVDTLSTTQRGNGGFGSTGLS